MFLGLLWENEVNEALSFLHSFFFLFTVFIRFAALFLRRYMLCGNHKCHVRMGGLSLFSTFKAMEWNGFLDAYEAKESGWAKGVSLHTAGAN